MPKRYRAWSGRKRSPQLFETEDGLLLLAPSIIDGINMTLSGEYEQACATEIGVSRFLCLCDNCAGSSVQVWQRWSGEGSAGSEGAGWDAEMHSNDRL